MSVLLSRHELDERRAAPCSDMSSLAAGLRRELSPLLERPPEIPRDKAMLSRAGGRCAIDGALLTFHPFDTRHVCPVCGREHAGGLHDWFRLYWYQLWLAERVVHAALLGTMFDDGACTATAMTLLDGYADQYLRYPNADNVLGPSRPFFSTYLESIWLLQLIIALDLLEMGAPSNDTTSLGARVRDRLVAPSAALIASYDEGMSNRQVWNNAAMLAAARVLDDRVTTERVLHGANGLHAHLGTALLSDGSWYEGENYHLFAHRGLWYGVRIAAASGHVLPPALALRYREAFAAPFRTVLPDLTYPSRRDSQYAVSIRQPRFAESCELGLHEGDDPRLLGMLARLYDPAVPRGHTGRTTSTADVERNLPGTGLRRDDLSWRSLLFARPGLPPLHPHALCSDLLAGQGLGIIRRNGGAVYLSLDYGHSGGGHGHPDRLNLTLADGAARWFDDPGTGSYVDATLHWYRSTLAHNAPLIDGHSQPRQHGTLLGFEDDGHRGWVSAHVALAPGLDARRSIIVFDGYVVDELSWHGDAEHEVALPIHGVEVHEADVVVRRDAHIEGGTGLEDGFSFLTEPAELSVARDRAIRLHGEHVGTSNQSLRGWCVLDRDTTVWSAMAPVPPGRTGCAPMLLLRQTSSHGALRTVWTWCDAIESVALHDDRLVVVSKEGAVHQHERDALGWRVQCDEQHGSYVVHFPERADADPRAASPTDQSPDAQPEFTLPATFKLGAAHYRRSEFTWEGAGAPHATVRVTRPGRNLVRVEVDMPSSERLFVPLATENPLDNEVASINGDSVQLYAVAGNRGVGALLVPHGDVVESRTVDGWRSDMPFRASWRPLDRGYRLDVTLQMEEGTSTLALDVLVNDVVAGRARRRGQLALSGARGEFVYLRGDRHDPDRLIRFSLV